MTDSSASRHSMVIITASVEISVTTLVTMLGTVPVMALCAPTTSLLKRETISPDSVGEEAQRHARCRCLYISWRKSKMMPSPAPCAEVALHGDDAPVGTGMPNMAAARRLKRRHRGGYVVDQVAVEAAAG